MQPDREQGRGLSTAITVQAVDRAAALAQVPPYVADRTVADEVREVPIP